MEKLLKLEEQTSEALLALKKARAIFHDLCNDCQFEEEPISDLGLIYFRMYHDETGLKSYAVSDYINEAIDLLESADFSEVIED